MRLGVFFAENPQNQPDVKVLSILQSRWFIHVLFQAKLEAPFDSSCIIVRTKYSIMYIFVAYIEFY